MLAVVAPDARAAGGPVQLLLPFRPVVVGARFSLHLPRRRTPHAPPVVRHQLPLDFQRRPDVRTLLRRLATPRPLTRDDDRQIRHLLATPLPDAQRSALTGALVHRLEGLVRAEVNRLCLPAHAEDLMQDGRLLIVQALRATSRDATRPLLPYLTGVLRRGLPRIVNTTYRTVRVADRQMHRVCALWRQHPPDVVRTLSVSAIARSLKLTTEQARNVQGAIAALDITSLSPLDPPATVRTPEQDVLDAEARHTAHQAFADALQTLDPTHRALLLARYPLGAPPRTLADAARLCGTTPSAARQMFRHIQDHLKKRVSTRAPAPEDRS